MKTRSNVRVTRGSFKDEELMGFEIHLVGMPTQKIRRAERRERIYCKIFTPSFGIVSSLYESEQIKLR
jgi:hypothetical protein